MSSAVIHGRTFGKESHTPDAKGVRAILPLPAFMQVLDAILAQLLNPCIDELLPATPESFIGARPKTQCLEIAHGLQSVIEKGLDLHGAAAIAQSDIEKYYDSLPMLRIAAWLTERGVSPELVACYVRHQMCPQIVLHVGSAQAPIVNRTVGGLTGSRIAGCFGRVPVESIAVQRSTVWQAHGFHAGSDVMCLCTWVDNLFSASDSLAGAICILEDFEEQLESKWDMRIKPSSRSCMCAQGNSENPTDPTKWPLRSSFVVLGHYLQENGSVRECWSKARSSMWRAYWANPGSRDAVHVSVGSKLAILRRAVLPQVSFRCSRWPPQKQIAKELDKMQQNMTASIVRLPQIAGEDAPEYVRRRGRAARKLCRDAGSWSSHWFSRVRNWDDHLARERNQHTWAARLQNYHGKQWLIDRRIALAPASSASVSIFAGRTGTRAAPGHVFTRWHDGVDMARS